MANYKRARIEGGTYFFTLVTHSRYPLFQEKLAKKLLGIIFRESRQKWRYEIDAMVLLPDHLHAIWTLPRGDRNFSMRWAWIKKEFSKRWVLLQGLEQQVSINRQYRGDRGIWQPRFWEHTIQDEKDFDRHFDYIHYNPVKHGYVTSPSDWPESTFHKWVKQGVYEQRWGCHQKGILKFEDIQKTTFE